LFNNIFEEVFAFSVWKVDVGVIHALPPLMIETKWWDERVNECSIALRRIIWKQWLATSTDFV